MDLRSPFVVSLIPLPRQEGSHMTWEEEFAAPGDLGVELIGVPEGSPVQVSLSLQSVSEGVWVSGQVHVNLSGRCSRCLRDLEEERTESIGELIFYPERKAAILDLGEDEDAEDLPVIVDDHIDLEPIIRDAIVLGLPFQPLCRPDCPGLCSECGQRWDDLPEDHHHEHTNPTFDVLEGIRTQLEAEQA
ncbi:YceD family protein [Changpingibacter yushuensis]|uniref:YceD family protein n=1 Tax=Changpingibacter yushuensis TaxID=2758440 RepID=UPI00165E90E2|nr:YceD family protein [Changpingibacter yushuensis]